MKTSFGLLRIWFGLYIFFIWIWFWIVVTVKSHPLFFYNYQELQPMKISWKNFKYLMMVSESNRLGQMAANMLRCGSNPNLSILNRRSLFMQVREQSGICVQQFCEIGATFVLDTQKDNLQYPCSSWIILIKSVSTCYKSRRETHRLRFFLE